MFSNLCVYGRCVNIFGMFRCECDAGYALDGSGGEFMNSLKLLKCLHAIFRCINMSLLYCGRLDFHDIAHICVHTDAHKQCACVCIHIHRQIL
jgi:hypothetical protein